MLRQDSGWDRLGREVNGAMSRSMLVPGHCVPIGAGRCSPISERCRTIREGTRKRGDRLSDGIWAWL